MFKSMKNTVDNQSESVLFNCKSGDNINAMFFTDFMDAHTGYPTLQQYVQLTKAGHHIVVFENKLLPDYLENDDSVLKLNENYYW